MSNVAESLDGETLERLARLDELGFLCPSEADPQSVISSAHQTLSWAEGIRESMRIDGEAEVMGEKFAADQLVPDEILEECLQPVENRYAISPGWVPAFYSNRLLPWYVGGACFYDRELENSRVCFVLRSNFRDSPKWLFYSRQEIISHEICHVARSGMYQNIFEEPLAYRISAKKMRRTLGPMFRSSWEGVAVLGSSLVLLGGSGATALGAPQWIHYAASTPLLATGTVLGARALNANILLKKAVCNLRRIYGECAEAIAFRCTDHEIFELADNKKDTSDVIDQCSTAPGQAFRWAIISKLFQNEGGNTRKCEL